MIVWLFTILDGISLVALSLVQFNAHYSVELILLSGLYLIGKGIAFGDTMSLIDAGCGVYILIALLFKMHSFIYYLILGWFIYKFAVLFVGSGS